MITGIKESFSALTVFRSLCKDKLISSLVALLSEDFTFSEEACAIYGNIAKTLYESGHSSVGEYIRNAVCNDENVYIKAICSGREVPGYMKECAEKEVAFLSELASLASDCESLKKLTGASVFLPSFGDNLPDICSEYSHRTQNIGTYGYGMYARYYVFRLSDNGNIVPVEHPDDISLSELVDYEREKKIITDNTLALIKGKPAANMLLTGDAGTGKSSTVKAVVNHLHTQGVRILEVTKEQLRLIPAVLDELSVNPLKFIIFIDDLSFSRDDDNFSALKAVLEGSVSAKSGNVVIYATSNRRHLVKESFSDRDGDDIHRNDTMQEIVSLSDRFGINLTFYRPDKKTYLHIVTRLAREKGITLPDEELEAGAERFVLGRGNRSARAARQYVDSLLSGQDD